MPVVIENLQVTVRVKTAARAKLSQVDEKENTNRAPQRVHLMPPPKPSAAAGEAQVPLGKEERPRVVASAAERVDLHELSERVYEFMRYDIRVARERRGSGR
jgi:hypothetical protein